MIRLLRALIVALPIFATAGCAGLLDPGPPVAQVILPVQFTVAKTSDRMPARLLVGYPVTDAAADTDRILALMNGYEIRALSEARWVNPAPAMVQRLLIDSLEASRRLEAVGWEESGIDAGMRLTTDIRRFHLRYETPGTPPVAEVMLVLGLVDTKTGKIFGRKAVSAEQPCAESSVKEFVAAFVRAMTGALEESNIWILDRIAGHLAARPG